MQKFLPLLIGPLLCARVFAISDDLSSSWSDTSNPMGNFTLRSGSSLVTSTTWGDSLPSPQPSWGFSNPGGLPDFFKSQHDAIGADWKTGDVIVHTQDDNFGPGNGQANVLWTSPIDGVVNVTGHVWLARDIGRSDEWKIYVGGDLASQGSLSSGDPYDRAHPFDFDQGSGGMGVLHNLHVTVGEQIILELDRTSTYGDYIGMSFNISSPASNPVPENLNQGLWVAIAFGCCVGLRRFRA